MDTLQLIKNKIYYERKTENGKLNGEALNEVKIFRSPFSVFRYFTTNFWVLSPMVMK